MSKYIDADRLIRRLENRTYRAKGKFIEMINEQEAADVVEVRHGRWIHKDPSGTSCSKCGSLFPMFMGLYDYCPNCGANMQGEEECGE